MISEMEMMAQLEREAFEEGGVEGLHKYRQRCERQEITACAAAIYHALYPRSNFYSRLDGDNQRKYENAVKELFQP